MSAVESYLLTSFRGFCREVVRLKREVERAAPPPATGGTAAEPASTVTAVRERLIAALERQAAGAARIGGVYSSEIYEAAQYVMAAYADDVFLRLDWPGRHAWQANLLQSHLFGTHRAGQELFQRLDTLLQSRDPVYTDLAKVYLFALGLGFQGRYRDTAGGPAKLEAYRRQLFDLIANREPRLASGSEPLFAQAYANTLADAEEVRLPYLRRWVIAACCVAGTWLVVQWRLWVDLTERLWPLVLQILGAS